MRAFIKTISAGVMVIVGCTIFTACIQTTAQTNNQNKMEKKILFVVTSHDQKGSTGTKTGYYLSEVSHPWEVLHSAGYEIDFVSKCILENKNELDYPGLKLNDTVSNMKILDNWLM